MVDGRQYQWHYPIMLKGIYMIPLDQQLKKGTANGVLGKTNAVYLGPCPLYQVTLNILCVYECM